MREITYAMTRASFDRLEMLASPDKLPLPFDPASIRPFAFQHNNGVLGVYYEQRGLMYVSGFDVENGANVVLLYGKNDDLDTTMIRVLKKISQHVDECGRLLRAQKRNQKDQPAAVEPAVVRHVQGDITGGLRTEDKEKIIINDALMEEAKKSATKPNEFSVRLNYLHNTDATSFSITGYNQEGGYVTLQYVRDNPVNEAIGIYAPAPDNPYGLDAQGFVKEMQRRVDRRNSITQNGRINDLLKKIPEAQYSATKAIMTRNVSRNTMQLEEEILHLDSTAYLTLNERSVSLTVDELSVMIFAIQDVHDRGTNNCIMHMLSSFSLGPVTRAEEAEIENKIGSLWAEYVAKKLDVDPDAMRVDDADDVPVMLEEDDGYRF